MPKRKLADAEPKKAKAARTISSYFSIPPKGASDADEPQSNADPVIEIASPAVDVDLCQEMSSNASISRDDVSDADHVDKLSTATGSNTPRELCNGSDRGRNGDERLPSTPAKVIRDESQCTSQSPSSKAVSSVTNLSTPLKSVNHPSRPTPSTPKTGTFKAAWETEFLVTLSEDKTKLVCLICGQNLAQIKKDNARKHMTRNHKDSVDKMTLDTKKKLKEKYLSDMKKGQDQVQQFLGPQNLINTAPYKLAYTIAKHKMPFSACEAFVEFAKAADPDNPVFQKMATSRQTITRKIVEVHQKIVQADVVAGVKRSLYWSYIIDESMDKKLKEQLGIYVRYINLQEEKVAVHFLAYEDVKGRPNSTNLFNSIKSRFDEHDLPTNRLVSHTSDNAAVVVSEMNGVAGKAKREFNPKLFIQRCTTHTEVLVAKDGQKKIPAFVEKTIKDILNNFRWSGVRKQEFEDLCNLNDERYKSLVTYHRVRWLSLESCVNRICDLLQPLAVYFDDQANSRAVSPAERKRNQDLYDRVSSPEFLLYLYFLKSQLPQFADINRELQKKNQTLYATYRRIFTFMRVIVSPVVCDDTVPLDQLMEHENLIDVSIHDVQDPPPFGAKDFRDYWIEVIENGHLSEKKLKEVFNNCFSYIVTIGRAFLKRFPEAEFVLKHCQFLEPERRTVRCDKSIPTVVERFNNGFLDQMEVLRAYKLYRLDDGVDDLLKSKEVEGNVVKFWCKLEKKKEFQPFARLCILLLTVQPDTCDLERGFSVMNKVKNEYRARLTQENLNAAVAVAMEERDASEMCFTRCLQ